MDCKGGIELFLARNTYMGKPQINVDSSVQIEGNTICLLSPLVNSWRITLQSLSWIFLALPPLFCGFSKKHLYWICNRRVQKCTIRPLEFNIVRYSNS